MMLSVMVTGQRQPAHLSANQSISGLHRVTILHLSYFPVPNAFLKLTLPKEFIRARYGGTRWAKKELKAADKKAETCTVIVKVCDDLVHYMSNGRVLDSNEGFVDAMANRDQNRETRERGEIAMKACWRTIRFIHQSDHHHRYTIVSISFSPGRPGVQSVSPTNETIIIAIRLSVSLSPPPSHQSDHPLHHR